MTNNASVLKQYEDNVAWIKRNVSEEKIYEFAEQALMGAEFFLAKLLNEEYIDDILLAENLVKKWRNNIFKIRFYQKNDVDIPIDTTVAIIDM